MTLTLCFSRYLAYGCARFLDVVAALQAHPEVGAGAEEFGKAQGGIRSDAALLVEDGCDQVGGTSSVLARALAESLSLPRSSLRISPGCMVRILFMFNSTPNWNRETD